MPVTAKLRYLRIAPRKARLVADLIRGKSVKEARAVLGFVAKRAATLFLKLLDSAVANAKNNFQVEETNLYISRITVDEGPKYKRWMPRARGQASPIQKKTSHVTLILDTVGKKPKKAKSIKKAKGIEKVKKVSKIEKPKLKPTMELPKPKIEKGIKRIFRRKAF